MLSRLLRMPMLTRLSSWRSCVVSSPTGGSSTSSRTTWSPSSEPSSPADRNVVKWFFFLSRHKHYRCVSKSTIDLFPSLVPLPLICSIVLHRQVLQTVAWFFTITKNNEWAEPSGKPFFFYLETLVFMRNVRIFFSSKMCTPFLAFINF